MFGTSIIRHLLLENRYQKEITEKHYRAYVKSKEIEMITRQERIKEVIYKNRNELGYKSSSFYAEAFVDGQIEAEKEQTQKFYKDEERMTLEDAIKKLKSTHAFYVKNSDSYDNDAIEKCLVSLEALGLIKFDEPEPLMIKLTMNNGLSWNTFTIDEIAKALEKYDFEIIPKGTKS